MVGTENTTLDSKNNSPFSHHDSCHHQCFVLETFYNFGIGFGEITREFYTKVIMPGANLMDNANHNVSLELSFKFDDYVSDKTI